MTNKLDARQLRNCFGHWTTGVAVVGYELDGEPRGATINGFTSVSLDPPLVLVSMARTARPARHSRPPFVGHSSVRIRSNSRCISPAVNAGLVARGRHRPRFLAARVARLDGVHRENYDAATHMLFWRGSRYDAWRGKPLVLLYRVLPHPAPPSTATRTFPRRPTIAEWSAGTRFHECSNTTPSTRPAVRSDVAAHT